MKYEKKCKVCNRLFTTEVPNNQLYCSEKCRGIMKYKKLKEKRRKDFKPYKICQECGKVFKVTLSRNQQKYCSTKCVRRQMWRRSELRNSKDFTKRKKKKAVVTNEDAELLKVMKDMSSPYWASNVGGE